MKRINISIIIISVIILLAGISYMIYPWFEGDYLATVVIVGAVGLSFGLFNRPNIKLWKKILFIILVAIGISVLVFFLLGIINLISQGSSAHSGFFTGG